MAKPMGRVATGSALLVVLAAGATLGISRNERRSAPAAPAAAGVATPFAGEPQPADPTPSPLRVTHLAPAFGSELGRERVTIFGSAFTDGASVFFGDAAAAVVEIRADRLLAKTPRGRGRVAVRVVAKDGSEAAAAGGYEFVPAHLAARMGRVGMGEGDREDVVRVNGMTGDGAERVVTLGVDEALRIDIVAPSSRAASRFALYCWDKEPVSATLSFALRGMGALVFPTPFTRVMPYADETTPREPDMCVIWNNTGNERWLGPSDVPSVSAPCTVTSRTDGIGRAATLTFQGVIEDDGAETTFGWSITNAVVVRTRR